MVDDNLKKILLGGEVIVNLTPTNPNEPERPPQRYQGEVYNLNGEGDKIRFDLKLRGRGKKPKSIFIEMNGWAYTVEGIKTPGGEEIYTLENGWNSKYRGSD